LPASINESGGNWFVFNELVRLAVAPFPWQGCGKLKTTFGFIALYLILDTRQYDLRRKESVFSRVRENGGANCSF
jgi:hypothetical protein